MYDWIPITIKKEQVIICIFVNSYIHEIFFFKLYGEYREIPWKASDLRKLFDENLSYEKIQVSVNLASKNSFTSIYNS